MSLLVLDASVAAKWFLPRAGEPLTKEALALLDRYAKGDIEFEVPDLFWAEFANILWKCVRMGRLSEKSAADALTSMMEGSFPTTGERELAEPAFAIAVATGRTIYDSMYVALAVQKDAAFITADERLVNALATHWPVRWLGLF